jgi:hypothetical protein
VIFPSNASPPHSYAVDAFAAVRAVHGDFDVVSVIVQFLVTSTRIFDFASLNFQVSMYGLAARETAAIINDRGTVTVAIRAVFMAGVRQNHLRRQAQERVEQAWV